MKINHVLFKLVGVAICLMPAISHAGNFEDPAVYFAVRGGTAKAKVKETNSFKMDEHPFAIAVGTKFSGSPLRTEIEYSNYSSLKYTNETEIDSGGGVMVPYTQEAKFGAHTFILNAFLDLPYEECCPPLLRPYIFAGIGITYMTANVKNYQSGAYVGSNKDSDWPWVWNVGAGLDVAINQAVFIEFRGRFLKTFTADELNAEIESTDLLIGVRFNMY